MADTASAHVVVLWGPPSAACGESPSPGKPTGLQHSSLFSLRCRRPGPDDVGTVRAQQSAAMQSTVRTSEPAAPSCTAAVTTRLRGILLTSSTSGRASTTGLRLGHWSLAREPPVIDCKHGTTVHHSGTGCTCTTHEMAASPLWKRIPQRIPQRMMVRKASQGGSWTIHALGFTSPLGMEGGEESIGLEYMDLGLLLGLRQAVAWYGTPPRASAPCLRRAPGFNFGYTHVQRKHVQRKGPHAFAATKAVCGGTSMTRAVGAGDGRASTQRRIVVCYACCA